MASILHSALSTQAERVRAPEIKPSPVWCQTWGFLLGLSNSNILKCHHSVAPTPIPPAKITDTWPSAQEKALRREAPLF